MDVLNKVVDVIIYAGIVQGFFITFILNSARNLKRRQNRVLSVLLVLLSMAIIHSVFIADELEQLVKSPFKIKEPFILLIGPILWFYIKEISGRARKFDTKSVIHFVPFILFIIFFIPFHVHGEEWSFTRFIYHNTTIVSIVALICVLIQYAFYLIKIVRLNRVHLNKVEQEFSNIEEKNLSWVTFLMATFFLVYILFVVALVSLIHQFSLAYFDKAISLILSILIFSLGYKGILQKNIFSNRLVDEDIIDKKEIQSIVSPKNKKLAEKLLYFMDESKPYLNPELTLGDLARELNVGRNTLSQAINSSIGENFYNFVNKYRVEEVKRYLSDKKNRSFTILSLAYEAGFNSKSSFNNIFKKFTGLSPTEYLNSLK